jgi:hypothetical protein
VGIAGADKVEDVLIFDKQAPIPHRLFFPPRSPFWLGGFSALRPRRLVP